MRTETHIDAVDRRSRGFVINVKGYVYLDELPVDLQETRKVLRQLFKEIIAGVAALEGEAFEIKCKQVADTYKDKRKKPNRNSYDFDSQDEMIGFTGESNEEFHSRMGYYD